MSLESNMPNLDATMEDNSQSNNDLASNASSLEQMSKSSSQPLIDFLQYLEDYKPTIPDSVTAYHMNSSGFTANDPKVLRLVSIASQKFIADIANDALQHCKMRTALAQNKKAPKDKRYTLKFEDLIPVLTEYGINIKKPQYFF